MRPTTEITCLSRQLRYTARLISREPNPYWAARLFFAPLRLHISYDLSRLIALPSRFNMAPHNYKEFIGGVMRFSFLLTAFLLLTASPVSAQSTFYQGKTITLSSARERERPMTCTRGCSGQLYR